MGLHGARRAAQMIGWNHSATAVVVGLDHWVEQSALHRLLTPLGRRPWPPLPHGRLQVKPRASLFQPDLFQPLSHLLAVFQLAVVQRAADSRCRGACSEAAAHLPGKTGKFQGRCQGKHAPGQQEPAQVMHPLAQNDPLMLALSGRRGGLGWESVAASHPDLA